MILCLACYEDRLASVFENSTEFKLFRVDDKKNIYPAGHVSLPSKDPTDRTSAIMACGVNLLVCGALCGGARRTLESSGVILAPWLRGEVSEVLDAYQGDRLDALSMPGCRNRMGQRGECTPPGPRCRGALAGMAAPEKKTDGGNMKIAISSEGPGLESKLDPRFGRATGFVLYDPQTKAHEYVSNEQNLSLPQGAGIQAAQHVAGTGAGVVITGHMGPKAYLALERGNVQIYLGGEGTVAKAIEDYEAGRLEKAQGPDKQGHW